MLKLMERHKDDQMRRSPSKSPERVKKADVREILPLSRLLAYPQVSVFLFDRVKTKEKVRPK